MTNLLFSITGQSIMLKAQDEIEQRLWALYPNCKVVKKPVGGSPIASWQRGQPNYNAVLAEIKQAQLEGFVYAANIFQNGQTDAKFPAAAKQWKTLFWAFNRDLRADIGVPNAAVIYGRNGKRPKVPDTYRPDYTEWEIIQQLQDKALINHPAFVMFDLETAGDYDEENEPYCHYLPGNTVADLVIAAVAGKVKINKRR